MILKSWDKLPDEMKNPDVKKYYDLLIQKKGSLFIKRCFDFFVSLLLLIILLPVFLILALLIAADSKGPVFFKQNRVTQYNRCFKIFKFRTMVQNADRIGSQVTLKDDKRITRVGKFLRKYRLDELPQLINVLIGDMSFVGTRPEVLKYTQEYTPEMRATLLMPAGVTSFASIAYKDEEKLLAENEDTDQIYIDVILPEKMKYNLQYIVDFSFSYDLKLMWKTIFAVMKD